MANENMKIFSSLFSQQTAEEEKSWILERRLKSAKLAQALGLPEKKNESWKYTNIQKLLPPNLQSPAEVDLESLEQLFVKRPELNQFSNRVVLCDGRWVPQLSKSLKTQELSIQSLYETLGSSEEEHLKSWWSLPLEIESVFSAVNEALFSGGVAVRVSKNKVIAEPLHIIHLSSGQSPESFSASKVFIDVAESGSLQLVESFVSLCEEGSVLSSETQVRIAENASLDYAAWQEMSEKTLFIQNFRGHQKRNSQLNSFLGHVGCGVARTEVEIALAGEGAEAMVNGLNVLGDKQHIDTNTILKHLSPHTQSDQLFKGVLNGSSKSIFSGQQYIATDAQKVNSNQLNKNLLLSSRAEANSRPQLEVNADDVKATHGATVGQMNSDELFYLLSRAIPKTEAEMMLAEGFAQEVSFKIKKKSLLNYIQDQVSKSLKAMILREKENV